jgi:hypothetical protein
MRSPIQASPVSRYISTVRYNSGIQPSDSVTEQKCEHGSLTKYCFWGQRERGCDATGRPYITCKA